MKRTLFLILIGVGLMFLFQQCATILGSHSNTLVVESSIQDSIKVYLDGDLIGTGPGKIKLKSRQIQHGSEVVLKSDSAPDETYLILRKAHFVYTFADALLGGIPLAVDFGTGQLYRPKPRKFNYQSETTGNATK